MLHPADKTTVTRSLGLSILQLQLHSHISFHPVLQKALPSNLHLTHSCWPNCNSPPCSSDIEIIFFQLERITWWKKCEVFGALCQVFLFCQVVDLTGCLPHLKASGLVKLTCAWVATCNPHLFSFQDNTSSCCFSANGNYVRWLAMLTKPPLCCLRHQLFATSPLPRLLSPCLALVCDIKHTANATLSAAG